MAVRVFYLKLVLEDTQLIYTGYFGTRVIKKSDILNTRNLQSNYGICTIDLTVRGKMWAPTISFFGPIDDAIEAWFKDIPNADYQEAVETQDSLLANSAFGDTVEQRALRIDKSETLLSRWGWVAVAIGLWGFVPYPYDVCLSVLIVWPILVLVAVAFSKGRWTINGHKGTLSAGNTLVLLPSLALGLRAILDNQGVEWWHPALWAIPAAFVLMGLVAVIERRADKSLMAINAILYFMYACGTLNYLNVALDTQDARNIHVTVLKADAYRDSYTLTLGPWESREAENTLDVPRRVYEQAKTEKRLCLKIHPGALGWSWYEIYPCRAAS